MAALSERKNRGNGFISGVLVLSLSTVIVKIIGLIYKIPMLRLLGSEGMGYFNSAYEIYTLFCTVATTGLPVAMAVMISSAKEEGDFKKQRIFAVAIKLFLLLGILGSLALAVFAKPFSSFIGGDGAIRCIFAIAPTVFFICISSAYRGYFQGLGNMTPTAISQMIEAAGKLVLGMIFAVVALNSGAKTGVVAAFATLGLTLGNAISLLYLAVVKACCAKSINENFGDISEKRLLSALLRLAIPISLSSAVISLTKVIDMTVILKRLQSMGNSASEAFAAYGNYTTLALPLFGLAPALISSIALPLVPALSKAVAENDMKAQKKAISDAIGLTVLLSMPISLGLTFFAEPILNLIFNGESAAIVASAPLLTLLGPSVTLACMITVGNAILQAYGAPSLPIMSMAIGSSVKIALAYWLIGIEQLGLAGAPISTFACDLIINVINLAFVGKYVDTIPDFTGIFLRPFAMSAVAVSVARIFYNVYADRIFNEAAATVLAIFIAGALYCVAVISLGELKRYDVSVKLKKNN